ncbi:hypothetical protein EDD85DRAFT_960977 [Armillaria nabsnona]|nr:hypothetical protein EDD85DRAFT_960977 [Armillaria nabsnona]
MQDQGCIDCNHTLEVVTLNTAALSNHSLTESLSFKVSSGTESNDSPIITILCFLALVDSVVIYLSGLEWPLSLKDGDLDSDQYWFQQAWTVQEGGWYRIIAEDTPDGLMHARTIDENGNYETNLLTKFHKQLKSECQLI